LRQSWAAASALFGAGTAFLGGGAAVVFVFEAGGVYHTMTARAPKVQTRQEDVGALRTDVGALRTEVRSEVGLLRTDSHSDMGALALRTEMRALRTEWRAGMRELNGKMDQLLLHFLPKPPQ
jgi:hypothetical protein